MAIAVTTVNKILNIPEILFATSTYIGERRLKKIGEYEKAVLSFDGSYFKRYFWIPRLLTLCHRIRIHRRATRVGAFEVFEAAHVALRTLLAFSQPVNCIFWPIGMLNWLVAASKLHNHRETCCTAEWPFYSFLIL